MTSPLVSTVIFTPSWRMLTGKVLLEPVVRNRRNSGWMSGRLRSSTSFSRVGIHDGNKCVFWYSSHVPSSDYFLYMANACLPWPWPSESCLSSLPIFFSVNLRRSASGSEPGVIMKISGVSRVELYYPSSILNSGGSTKCLPIESLINSLIAFVRKSGLSAFYTSSFWNLSNDSCHVPGNCTFLGSSAT